MKAAKVGKDEGVVDANDKEGFIAAAKTRQWDRESLYERWQNRAAFGGKEVTEFAGTELEAGQGRTE